MSRTTEAQTFLAAFAHHTARAFVNTFLKENYAKAILTHHPDARALSAERVRQQCDHLVDTAFERIAALPSPEELFPLFAKLSRGRPQREPIWFDAFTEAYRNYKHHHKLQNRYRFLAPYLRGSRYADVGCGGGDLVAYLKNEHAPFTEAAGIDVMDWRTDAVKEEIDFQTLDFSRPGTFSRQMYDSMTCLAVLHHVGNTDEAQGIFLQNLHRSLAEGGRLIVEEDVILPADEIAANPDYHRQIDVLLQEQGRLGEFLAFEAATQRNIIILIDYLANALAVGVPEMAFPCGFRSLESWASLFSSHGFTLSEVRIAGFVQGNFNQSAHVFFVLDKQPGKQG
jgi:2-polyprenyl-3-methyl-5-hydroxy-6-metoxy-1,4-benzoquinol methylase